MVIASLYELDTITRKNTPSRSNAHFLKRRSPTVRVDFSLLWQKVNTLWAMGTGMVQCWISDLQVQKVMDAKG
jgi:hypothetical protein